MTANDDTPSVETGTTVDMRIARIETHPQEFFDAAALHTFAAADVLKNAKWARLVARITSPVASGMFSPDEKTRFGKALDVAMRSALDQQILHAVMTDTPLGHAVREQARDKAASQLKQQSVLGGNGSATFTGAMTSGVLHNPHANNSHADNSIGGSAFSDMCNRYTHQYENQVRQLELKLKLDHEIAVERVETQPSLLKKWFGI